MAEILNNFVYYLLQNDFYLNKLNQMYVVFLMHFQQVDVLFWVNSWLRPFSLSPKSALVTKFAYFNLAAKFSAVSLRNTGVVI